MQTYLIEVGGSVEAQRLPLLEHAAVTHADGRTVVQVVIIDQSHLAGVLGMLQDRGFPLVSVKAMRNGPDR